MAYSNPMAEDGLGNSSDPVTQAAQTSPAFSTTSLSKTVNDQARQQRQVADTFGDLDENDPCVRIARLLPQLLDLSPAFPINTRVEHLPSGRIGIVKGTPLSGITVVQFPEGEPEQRLSIALKRV